MIEKDGYGDKVIRLANGNYFKLFRRKRIFSSALFSPYSSRFIKNAKRLDQLGVPTVLPLDLYSVPHIHRTAVQYKPLPGTTIRDEIKKAGNYGDLLKSLGEFLAKLHEQGIYFRSVHLGNIVVLETNDFGLIDVADLKFHRRPLSRIKRQRNFKHLLRPPEDALALQPYLELIYASYDSYREAIRAK